MLKDFIFDGVSASSMGLIIGGFSSASDSDETGNELSPITYRASRSNVEKLAASNYADSFIYSFEVMNNVCAGEQPGFTDVQVNNIMRWLVRDEAFYKLIPIYDNNEFPSIYYRGYFKVGLTRAFGKVVGFTLEFHADSPYAYQEFETQNYIPGSVFTDVSDKTGYLYADLELTVKASGDLTVQNDRDPDNKIIIKDVRTGDVIKLHGESKIIETSRSASNIYNNFNYNFLRIINSHGNRENKITANLDCDMKIKYTPVRRVGLIA